MAAQPLFVSSGDILADRRYHWALDYLERGNTAGAAEILMQAVAMAPGFATAWFALAFVREQMGDREGAIAAFSAAGKADREDYHGASLHLARLGAGEATPAMTAVYVRRLFDQHAPEFDRALLDRLDYRGPQILLAAVEKAAGGRLPRFATVLDLGCGTGLAGAVFRPHCDRLVGVDLSAGMIEQARAKSIYDRLVVADLAQHLAGEPRGANSLVLACDVLVYRAELDTLAAELAPVLAARGMFAFTVETHDGPGVKLQDTLRYAHGAEYVRAAIRAAGLTLLVLDRVSTGTESGEPMPGLVGVSSTSYVLS
jgi:predicted TPR repeat methyltransferase